MSIWDDIAKSASDAASFAVRKTGEFTSLAKMKLALHTEETKLSDCYNEIGRLYYMYQRDGKDLVSEIAQRIADADLVRERIAAIKSEICDLQDNMICPSCGEKISKNFEFCPICGTRQTKKSQESGGETTKAEDGAAKE